MAERTKVLLSASAIMASVSGHQAFSSGFSPSAGSGKFRFGLTDVLPPVVVVYQRIASSTESSPPR